MGSVDFLEDRAIGYSASHSSERNIKLRNGFPTGLCPFYLFGSINGHYSLALMRIVLEYRISQIA